MDDNNKKIEMTGKSETKFIYKFNDFWLQMNEFRDWLEKSTKRKGNCELAFCKLCKCNVLAHKSSLLKHRLAEKHKKNERKMDMDILNQSEMWSEKVKKADISSELYEFIAEQNLVGLSVPDSNIAPTIAAKRKKYTQIVRKAVGHNLDELYMKLKAPGMFFSLYMAETTDPSAIKQYLLTVLFIDEENVVRYSFFDMFKASSDLPKSLFISLKYSIKSKGIPLENLVGFSSDVDILMVDEINSFFYNLKKDYPNIAYIKSFCHTVQLAASKACLKLPTHVEDLLKGLGSHFSRNYGKEESFKELQEFFHVDIHKFLPTTTTSWLSLKECVDLVLEHYDPLQTYIRQFCIEDPFDIYQGMLDSLKNSFTKAYIEFMSYVLGIFCEFNVMFQKEIPLLHKLKPEVEKLLKEICLNFLPTDYVIKTPSFEIMHTDSIYHLPLDKIYLGVSASETINDVKKMPDTEEKDLTSFFESILNFYVELVTVLRTEFDFQDELYNVVSVVDPQIAQDFNINSLVCVWKRFPVLKKFINMQALDNEWKKHALLDRHLEELNPKMPADDYWRKVFKIKSAIGEQAFPNLYTTIRLLFVLPFFPTQVRVLDVIYQE